VTDPPQEPRRRPRPYPPGGGPPVDDDPAAVEPGEARAEPADEPTTAPIVAAIAGPGSGRRAALLAPAAVLVVAAVGVAVVFLVRADGNSGRAKSGSSPSEGSSQAPTYSASDSGTGTGTSSVAEVAARGIVLEYLDDVNARNEAAAGQLICGEKYPTWKKNAGTANGDLSYTVIDSTYRGAHVAAGGGLVVTYALKFDDGTSNNVAFTVVKQQSLKICGISRA
jgi:hypothetical protein